MPSLERFFDPQMRKFDANVKPLPGARLYFFENETTTPKVIYQDKQGLLPHENPVIADASGVFPQIFLDGLYRVELRSNKNIVQPGWPIDNIGQDIPVVPFGPWSEINTYNTGEIVTATNGDWYRSISDNNLGNDPLSSPSDWEIIPIPVASSFTSNKSYLTWSDDGDQISLNVDDDLFADSFSSNVAYMTFSSDANGVAVSIDEESLSTSISGFILDEINDKYESSIASDPNRGNFTNGTLRASRIGDQVVISGINFANAASDNPASAIGFLPANYRPLSTSSVCSFMSRSSGYILMVKVEPSGAIVFEYNDFSGAGIAQTVGSFTISYRV